jgi:hypothetical protein
LDSVKKIIDLNKLRRNIEKYEYKFMINLLREEKKKVYEGLKFFSISSTFLRSRPSIDSESLLNQEFFLSFL